MRTLRSLALGHLLGQQLMEEQDEAVSLLDRLLDHAHATAHYNVYLGLGRDAYDVRGRTAHESLFNVASGTYRGPSTQQGYSPFSTWSRGLAWAMLGFAEQLEFLAAIQHPSSAIERYLGVARATCDHYIDDVTASDGIPYWDDGAPGLAHMSDWRQRSADPFNDHEPVDSSAAAIAAQALIRVGHHLGREGARYTHAGLTVARTLLAAPYLSEDPNHQGLLLHSVYHRPNGWDHVPPGRKVPCGESSMWGDYHLLELGLLLRRLATGGPYYAFFDAPQ